MNERKNNIHVLVEEVDTRFKALKNDLWIILWDSGWEDKKTWLRASRWADVQQKEKLHYKAKITKILKLM